MPRVPESLPWRQIAATLMVAGAFLWFGWLAPHPTHSTAASPSLPGTVEHGPHLVGQAPDHASSGFALTPEMSLQGNGFAILTPRDRDTPVAFALVPSRDTSPGTDASSLRQLEARAMARDPDGLQARAVADASLPFALRVDEQGHVRGLYLDNLHLESRIRGFAGPLRIGLYLDAEGRIRDLQILDSHETPGYLRHIAQSGFYNQFRHLTVDGATHRIDAVSGATLSSRAIARQTGALVARAANGSLNDYLPAPATHFDIEARLSGIWSWHLLGIAVLFALAWQPWWHPGRTDRLALALSSVLLLGFLLNQSFSFTSLLQPALGGTLSVLMSVYCALVLLGVIWDRNTYCRRICPFGHAQRLVLRLDPGPRWHRWSLAPRSLYRIRLAVTLVLVTGILLGHTGWLGFELFPDLFAPDPGSFWTLAAFFLVLRLNARVPMLWCRMLCPTGAVLDLGQRLACPHTGGQREIQGQERGM